MNGPRPLAVLFDLDDTILDDSSSTVSAWHVACAGAAAELPGLTAAALYQAIDRVRTWYWSDPERHRQGRQDLRAATRAIVRQAMAGLGVDAPALADAVADRYRDLREEAQRLFPRAVETLEALRAEGIRLALLTNGAAAAQRTKIERFDLARHFDYICIEGEFGCGKPDLQVYRAALAALGCPAERTWMVGDNLEWDVLAPQRLGVAGIWLDRAGAGLPAGLAVRPSRIIRDLPELLPASFSPHPPPSPGR